MDKLSKTAIIPAAGVPTNEILSHSNLPDTMLPINGKPVIGYIIDDLLTRNISQVIVILNENDTQTENYINKKFSSKLTITIVRNSDSDRGVGYSIYCASKFVKNDCTSILVYLGDTIYKGPLSLENDLLVIKKDFESSDRWCFVEENERGQNYINKPRDYRGNGQALAGVYNFKDVALFREAVSKCEKKYEVIQISDILETYENDFLLIPAESHYDCGNVENYYRAKIDFLKIRNFNSLSYNDIYGTITKRGSNEKKILDEINWYKNIPTDLKVFSPRLIDYKINDGINSEYSLEYYGYQSLADYFIFNNLSPKVWYLILDRLLEIADLFRMHKSDVPFVSFDEVYRVKTLQRVSELRKNTYWNNLFNQELITINNQEQLGWPFFENKLESIVRNLYSEDDKSFIHGDLCLSNILFDPNSRIFKFIDPRGSFGDTSIFGDSKYDIAKLQHSISGKYDFIVSDLFNLTEQNNIFTFRTFHEPEHQTISNYFESKIKKSSYDLNTIRTIEALLFISMIPLHNDSLSRQKAMFVTGIKILNQITI